MSASNNHQGDHDPLEVELLAPRYTRRVTVDEHHGWRRLLAKITGPLEPQPEHDRRRGMVRAGTLLPDILTDLLAQLDRAEKKGGSNG